MGDDKEDSFRVKRHKPLYYGAATQAEADEWKENDDDDGESRMISQQQQQQALLAAGAEREKQFQQKRLLLKKEQLERLQRRKSRYAPLDPPPPPPPPSPSRQKKETKFVGKGGYGNVIQIGDKVYKTQNVKHVLELLRSTDFSERGAPLDPLHFVSITSRHKPVQHKVPRAGDEVVLEMPALATDLESILTNKQEMKTLSDALNLAYVWSCQFLGGLETLHTKFGLLHGDLKPENLLLTGGPGPDPSSLAPPRLKIADFDLIVSLYAATHRVGGSLVTTYYRWPELGSPERESNAEFKLTVAPDNFAAGLIMARLLVWALTRHNKISNMMFQWNPNLYKIKHQFADDKQQKMFQDCPSNRSSKQNQWRPCPQFFDFAQAALHSIQKLEDEDDKDKQQQQEVYHVIKELGNLLGLRQEDDDDEPSWLLIFAHPANVPALLEMHAVVSELFADSFSGSREAESLAVVQRMAQTISRLLLHPEVATIKAIKTLSGGGDSKFKACEAEVLQVSEKELKSNPTWRYFAEFATDTSAEQKLQRQDEDETEGKDQKTLRRNQDISHRATFLGVILSHRPPWKDRPAEVLEGVVNKITHIAKLYAEMDQDATADEALSRAYAWVLEDPEALRAVYPNVTNMLRQIYEGPFVSP